MVLSTSIQQIKTKLVTLSLVVFISSILVIGIGLTAYAQQQLQQTRVFILGSDGTTHEANLKATKEGGDEGQLRKVSTFKIQAPNVVQINQGKDLIVFTTNPEQDQVQRVKVRNTQGQLTELEPVTGSPNTYSLAGYPVGVYLLDVIVQLSDSNRQGAYETILVIIPSNQQPQPVNFAVILQTIRTVIDTDIRVIIDDDNGDDGLPPEEICDNGEDDDGNGLVDSEDTEDCPPECPEGQELVDGQCVPICEEGEEQVDGQCVPICEEGEERVDGQCVPICEEGEERVDGQCVPIPCPDGREPVDGVCPEPPGPGPGPGPGDNETITPEPIPPDPCIDDPDLPQCQAPPPPGPCPEGEECPLPLPPPGPEPEPGNGDDDVGDNGESNGSGGAGSEDDGGDSGDNGDNGDSDGGDSDGGE